MKQINKYSESINQTATYIGLEIAMMWSASFVCSMVGMKHPLIGAVGNIIAIYSVMAIYTHIVKYKMTIGAIGFAACWKLALLICIYSSIVTDMVQYLYFQFVDNGTTMNALMNVMETPEYEQLMHDLSPELSPDMMREILAQTSVQDIVLQMIVFNFLLSLPISLLTALFGYISKTHKQKGNGKQHGNDNYTK